MNIAVKQDGRPVELGDTLSGAEAAAERSDLAMDIEHSLVGLPAELRALWDLRVKGIGWTEISRLTGVPRPTIHDRWGKVCQHLKAALGEYFDKT